MKTKSLNYCNSKDVQYVNPSCSDSLFLCANLIEFSIQTRQTQKQLNREAVM